MVTKVGSQELCLWLGNVHTDSLGRGKEVALAGFVLFYLDDASFSRLLRYRP